MDVKMRVDFRLEAVLWMIIFCRHSSFAIWSATGNVILVMQPQKNIFQAPVRACLITSIAWHETKDKVSSP